MNENVPTELLCYYYFLINHEILLELSLSQVLEYSFGCEWGTRRYNHGCVILFLLPAPLHCASILCLFSEPWWKSPLFISFHRLSKEIFNKSLKSDGLGAGTAFENPELTLASA